MWLLDQRNRWQMPSYELLAKLGLPSRGPIPPDFWCDPVDVDGVQVMVTRRLADKRRFHRVMAECPACKRWLPAGRLHQHATRWHPKEYRAAGGPRVALGNADPWRHAMKGP